MIVDALTTFADAVAVTASAVVGDYQTRPQDTNTLVNEFGTAGKPLYLSITVTEAFATATSVNFALLSDSTTNLATSPTTHAQTGAILIAGLTAGTQFFIPISYAHNVEKYYGVYATVVGSNATAGKITARIATDHPSYKAYVVPYTNKTGR
jgi:non-ribosomal peptide synthetase component E (peptide arylation enzyme)